MRWSMKTASRYPAIMLNPIDRIPNHQILLIETIQRGVSHSRSYWARPTKLKFGKSFEFVNDQMIEKAMQITKMPIAVAAIGRVPITDMIVPERMRRLRPMPRSAGTAGASAPWAVIWVLDGVLCP